MAIKIFNQNIGNPFIELQAVESTNNYAMQQLQNNMATHGACFFAHTQTAGKGQRLKQWISEAGQNITLSVLLDTTGLSVSQLFEISVVVAVAAHDFFNSYALHATYIKWPNDIYWCDRKAGGILIENIIRGNKWQFGVAGIGLNINQTNFPPQLLNPVSLKQITGKNYDVIVMAKELCNYIQSRYTQLLQNGFKDLLHYYNAALYKKNETVKLKKEQTVFFCIVKEVNEYGQLITEGTSKESFEFGEVEWLIG